MMDQDIAAEQEVLLSFFYMCPVGILQTTGPGEVEMLNPMAAQLLMPCADGLVIANLFDVFEAYAPDLRSLVLAYAAPRGRICSNLRLFMGDRNNEACILSCTILKTSADCLMVMLDDVSEQVGKEQRLKEADTCMAAIISSVNDFACFSLDAAGLIDSWNESGLRQTGFTSTEIIGRTLERFRPVDASMRSCNLDHLAIARREGWHLHKGRCLTRDGLNFDCQILVTALKQNDSDVTGFSVVLRDVTERTLTSDDMRRLLVADHHSDLSTQRERV